MAAYAHTNPRLTRFQEERDGVEPGSVGIQTYEGVAEIDYGAQVTPWLTLRPNIQCVPTSNTCCQYVLRPSGAGAIPNAWVAGLYAQVML